MTEYTYRFNRYLILLTLAFSVMLSPAMAMENLQEIDDPVEERAIVQRQHHLKSIEKPVLLDTRQREECKVLHVSYGVIEASPSPLKYYLLYHSLRFYE